MSIAEKVTDRSIQAVENWITTKSELIRQQPWLKSYREFATPLDETLYESVNGIDVQAPYPHEVFLIEPLLADIAALLQRCSAYRQDLYTLEVNAVSSALTSTLGLTTGNIDLQLSNLRNRKEEADVLRIAEQKASEEFGDSGPLNKGFKAEAQGQAEAFEIISSRETKIQTLENERLQHIVAFNETMLTAMAAPGSGFSYSERYNQLKELLVEDFQEAYRKSKCADVGLNIIYSADERFATFRDLPVPEPSRDNYLNRLVSWTREAMRRLERISEFETEYDLKIPFLRRLSEAISPPVSAQEFAKSFATPQPADQRLDLDLSNFFPFQSAVRLRGAGLSYVVRDPMAQSEDLVERNRRIRCVVFPPEQSLMTGERHRRPPVLLNNVGEMTSDHSQVDMESGSNIYNVDPRGIWTIMLYPLTFSSSMRKDEKDYAAWNLLLTGGMMLHLRVRAVPKVNPDEWSVQ